MQKHYNYLNIDLDKKIHTKLKAKQGDSKSRYILVNLISNSTYYDLSDCAVKIYGIKKDKTIFFNHATVTNAKQGQFEIELTNQALAVAGELEIQILILGTNQERLTSFSFYIDVEKSIVNDGVIESANEFKALTESLSQVNEWNGYFEETSGKIEEKYTERLNNVDSQLAQKANDVEVRKKDVLIGQFDITDELKQAINGNAPILQTISDKSITELKTTFIDSINKFNKNSVTKGKYVSYLDGSMLENESYSVSVKIPIKQGEKYSRYPQNQHFACFNTNGDFVAYPSAPYVGSLITAPCDGHIVLSFKETDLDIATFIKSDTPISEYYPYELKIDTNLLPNIESKEITVNLPKKIYSVVGEKVQLYFENLKVNSNKYDKNVTCIKGIHADKRWYHTSDVEGDLSLVLDYYKDNEKVSSNLTTIKVAPKTAGIGSTKKCIFIGDSTTNHAVYTQALLDKFSSDVMSIELLGTRGISPNLHEGRSGWSALQYTTQASLNDVSNAFWDGSKFNFTYYMNQNSYTDVDYVFIHLGINDIFNIMNDTQANTEIPNILSRFDMMISSIKSFDSNIKVCVISTITCNNSQDAFGGAYGCNKTRWQYRRIYDKWINALLNKYEDRESENIYVVPCNVSLDGDNGFRDGVHPIETEYKTNMMQPIYNFIKYLG